MDMEEYFKLHQKELLDLANTEAGRFLLGVKDYPIVKLTPNSVHQLIRFEGEKPIIDARFYIFNRIAKILLPPVEKMQIAKEKEYEAFLHFSNLEPKNYKYPQIFLDSSSIYPSAGVSNAEGVLLYSSSAWFSWATCKSQTTATTERNNAEDGSLVSHTGSIGNDQYIILRYFFEIDYTSLPSGFTATEVVWNFNARYYHAPTTSIDISVMCEGTQSNTLVTSDFGAWGTDLGRDSSGLNGNQGWYSLTQNATGIAYVTSAKVKYAWVESGDFDNSAPGDLAGPVFKTASDSTSPPYMTVTYTPPITPISISDSGSGSDSISILAQIGFSDLGSGSDSIAIQTDIPISDSGSGSDSITTSMDFVNVSDSGSGDDSVLVQKNFSISDSGSGSDSISILDDIPVSDSGSGSDSVSNNIIISLFDTATALDTILVFQYIIEQLKGFLVLDEPRINMKP
ncbi:MAG: hypothetical protein ACRDFB_07175 [Rhabdochlamydiaceae bacterium]